MMRSTGGWVVTAVLATASLCFAQAKDDERKQDPAQEPQVGHLERPDQPYRPDVGRGRSPGGRYVRDGFVSVQVNVDPYGNNIAGDAANEPSIAIDATNHNRMVIGWRQFNTIASNFRQAGYGYTADGGRTWTMGILNPGFFRSDPVLAADADGNIFFNSLRAEGSSYWCTVFKTTDGGVTWLPDVYAYGGDKQWFVIDQTDGVGRNNQYAYWTQWYSDCYPGQFTRSTNGGASYEACTQIPNSPKWGTLAVGPEGELYVVGDASTVSRSDNAKIPGSSIVWSMTSTYNLDGGLMYSGGPNPGGLMGQIWIAVDHSDTPTRGNVYILGSVQRNSTTDPMDVMFTRSTDGGQTWSAPVRVNDDLSNSNWQWFGTMSVAPNGRIDAVWYDTRANPGTYLSELYYSYTENAGVTWSQNVALSPAFNPHVGWPQQNKIGDYIHMVSDDYGADLAYAATFNGEQDVYYIRIGESCADAGTVAFVSPASGCETTALVRVNDCGPNADPDVAETLQVSVASTTEPAGETITLTEIGPNVGVFEGSIALSETDAPGVLWVVEGDDLTATYIDADNGQGGHNVTVTGTAVVDCTPPVISNVALLEADARTALIGFDTDELARGRVRYGTSCGSLTGTAQGGRLFAHSVRLAGLEPGTAYFYIVEAEDDAGNVAVADNGGNCFTFATPEVADFFTEAFTTNNDLDYLTLVFTPDGSADYYRGCAEPITSLPTDPAGGTTLPLGDDTYQQVSVSGNAVSLYGVSYSSFFVNSNGNITFTSGDSDYTDTLEDHFSRPRISALFDDLNPSSGGTVSYRQLADRVAVTWLSVPEYPQTGANTFQVEMFFDGRITLSYLAISAQDGTVGLSEGNGLDPDFQMSDLSAMGACLMPGDMDCDGDVDFDDIDPFVLALEGQAAYQAAYPDCHWLNGDIDADGDVDFDDIDLFVDLLQ